MRKPIYHQNVLVLFSYSELLIMQVITPALLQSCLSSEKSLRLALHGFAQSIRLKFKQLLYIYFLWSYIPVHVNYNTVG